MDDNSESGNSVSNLKIIVNYKALANKIWNSPTLMTWLSYSTKAFSLFGVIPLVLKQLHAGDIALWYLFSTIIALQSIADFGFRATFSRIISYAFTGASDIGIFKPQSMVEKKETGPNLPLLHGIISIMKRIYICLTLVLLVLMLVFGTWSMRIPIRNSLNTHQSWICWLVVVFVTCVSFYAKVYMNYLEGLFKIATVRRVETLTSLGSIFSSIAVLIFYPSLLNLVVVNQVWVLIVSLRDWYLALKVESGLYKSISKIIPFDKLLFRKIWSPAWRSGLSGFMSVGLTNLTGLVYAQFGSSEAVASYLLALRIISQVRDVAMAPFYSKLPLLARLRVVNDLPGLIKTCRRGMFLSHTVFAVFFCLIGLFSGPLLKMIGSKVEFVNQWFWLLLGIAYFIHRYGGMHMQIYLSTNHIISHIADGISGILYIISALLLSKYVGIYAIPIAMLVGYLGFYAWYSAIYSYKSLQISFWRFEWQTSGLAILVLLFYSVYIYEFNV
jgi:hypothetical protein